MEENLNLIEQICGDKSQDQELIEIGSDPNFVFNNDPSFPVLRLFDVDGNVINVNSWIECAHYVNGGWSSTYYSGIKSELIFLLIVVFYSVGYFINKKRKLIKNNVKK
tara:strand:+ start:1388 stop:1711 length:324 start_codon:yes stop_codon:yes gene_type:complete